jgi:hypothetical protein
MGNHPSSDAQLLKEARDMTKGKSPRLTVAALLAAVVMLVAGGMAIASNVAFKANIPLELVTDPPGGFFQGTNRIALPFNNPYTSINDFCDQTGLVCGLISDGSVPCTRNGSNPASIQLFDAASGAFTARACGFGSDPLLKGQGIEVRQQVARAGFPDDVTPPSSLIIVGSHDPTFSIDMPAIAPGVSFFLGDYLFSVPYHTTSTNVLDVRSVLHVHLRSRW